VFLTDVGDEVLHNCLYNASHNTICGGAAVRELDWLWAPDWLAGGGGAAAKTEGGGGVFGWSPEDVVRLGQAQFLLAADVVYENTLTDGFMRTAAQLLRHCRRANPAAPPPTLLVALERRPCFTLAAMDVRCPAYDYWRTLFEEDGGGGAAAEEGRRRELAGRRVDLAAVPQHVREYERTEQLELWELGLRPEAALPA
jgi:hypothetical protein